MKFLDANFENSAIAKLTDSVLRNIFVPCRNMGCKQPTIFPVNATKTKHKTTRSKHSSKKYDQQSKFNSTEYF